MIFESYCRLTFFDQFKNTIIRKESQFFYLLIYLYLYLFDTQQMQSTKNLPLSLTGAGLEYHALADYHRFVTSEGKQSQVPMSVTQVARQKSHKRKLTELRKRWKTLTIEQRKLLAEGDTNEKKLIAFLAVLKTYEIAVRFVEEEVIHAFRNTPHKITYHDFDRYILRLEEEYPDLKNRSEATFNKIRSRIFGMMREVGMFEKKQSFKLHRPYLPVAFKHAVQADEEAKLIWFLHEQ